METTTMEKFTERLSFLKKMMFHTAVYTVGKEVKIYESGKVEVGNNFYLMVCIDNSNYPIETILAPAGLNDDEIVLVAASIFAPEDTNWAVSVFPFEDGM